MRRSTVILVLVVSALCGSCSSSSDRSAGGTSDSSPATLGADTSATSVDPSPSGDTTGVTGTESTSTEPEPTDTAMASDALSAKEVLSALQESVVFIETEWSAGTAMAVEGGYLLTNAHVVTPFGVADVTLPSGDVVEQVPVVGVDFDHDLALLGPLDDPLPPISAATVQPVTGDEVFLIGFPSETEAAPTPTISEGIVSRLRDVPEFDQHYIQTDAAIAGGQSGGALVDLHGDVVGVSGLSLDDAFALALAIDDALATVESLRAGGQPWQPFPDDGVTEASLTVPVRWSTVTLELIPASTDESVSITLSGDRVVSDVAFEAYLDDGTVLISRNELPLAAEQAGVTVEEIEAQIPASVLLDADLSGTYTFDVPADNRVTIKLNQLAIADPLPAGVVSTRPFLLNTDTDDGTPISVGDTVSGVITPLEWADRYTIDLTAGQAIDITVESAVGDMALVVLAPGEIGGADTFAVDDSNIGIGGLDAQGTFEAEVDGTYQIMVLDNAGQSGYHLSVVAG